MRPYRFPVFLRRFYRDGIFRIDNNEKVVYLTFDDGPTPGTTEKVIDILLKEDVPAFFFVLGRKVKTNPDLFSLLKSKGFGIGNHGLEHIKGLATKNTRYLQDADQGGVISGSRFFRPAFGSIRPSQFKVLKKKFKVVFWDIMPFDFNPAISTETMINATSRRLRPGSIIVLHDNDKSLAPVILPELINMIRQKGYSFRDLYKDINKAT